MKKLIFVFLLIPVLLFAQYNVDGRRIYNGTIPNAALSSTAVDGGVMLEATRCMWFPVGVDSGGAVSTTAKGTAGWALDASVPPIIKWHGSTTVAQYCTFGFDADTTNDDDIAYLTFVCPDDYKTDSMELYLYWFHTDTDGATTDAVEWEGALQAISSGEQILVAGTAITGVETTCTTDDSTLYITNLDPEVETIVAGDLITIKLFVDGDDAGGTRLDDGEFAYLIGVLIEYEAKDE